MMPNSRNLISLAAAAIAGMVGIGAAEAQTPPKPAQIVVNDSGGAMTNAMRQAFYTEFEKRYGIRVVATSPVDLGKLRAMVQSGNIEWTVTEIGGEDALRAEESGLLEPLDHSVIDFSKFPAHLRERKHIFAKGIYSTVLGYRTDVFKTGDHPKSWADFWDVKRFPGPRSLRNGAIDNLEFALLADGVPMDKLYPIDVDRAFRKMDEIKKNVTVWWTTGGQSAQLLVDKEVVMGTAWNGRFHAVITQGAPIAIEWNQGAIKESAFGIPKGAKDAYWGQRLLAIVAEAQPQGIYANLIAYPGLNLDAIKFTDPKMAPYLPTHPDHFPKQFFNSLEWWAKNGQAVDERWSRWMLAK